MRPPPSSVSESLTALWRGCADPRVAHRLAERVLPPEAYAHTRGVAQQAARLVHAGALPPSPRRRILAAAWLHDIGLFSGGATATARSLRSAGHEELARVVAHQVGAVERRPDAPPATGVPRPAGALLRDLDALDAAVLTTDQAGARVTPREMVAEIAGVRGTDDPWVLALVRRIAELGERPEAREWLMVLSPAAA